MARQEAELSRWDNLGFSSAQHTVITHTLAVITDFKNSEDKSSEVKRLPSITKGSYSLELILFPCERISLQP